MSYLKNLHKLPYPLGILGSLLEQFGHLLRDACFQDNEYGHCVQQLLAKRIVVPINRRLARACKPVRVISITPQSSEHHRMIVHYHIAGHADAGQIVVSLFEESKKKQALDRKEAAGGEKRHRSLPRRGQKHGGRVGKKRRKRAAAA